MRGGGSGVMHQHVHRLSEIEMILVNRTASRTAAE